MNMMQRLALTAATSLVFTTAAFAEIVSETVEYTVDGDSFTGYMVYDDDVEGERPGILVVHEWWGHNEFVRSQAEKLAKEGYTAFALDMYGTGKLAEHPDDAKKFMQATMGDKQALEARFREAMSILQDHETVDESQIAAQGYCFGGAVVLNMARLGLDLDGVVSLHGSLGSDIQPEQGAVTARILAYTGGADPFVPVEQVTSFVSEMTKAGADLSLTVFPGVKHSFTSKAADATGEKFGLPMAYNEEAANRAWEGTMAFYQDIFAQ
ncbi:dienelactone hydrolase family protein [Marinobacter psychrophilus]|uniref:dienelactone hydrolase family protein n=1 Tax=Marinobacter psychrophilus TaxID=330734 RepID=UPI001B719276|nr:dienelactone hydrolase family protein [Marinobacter psychrophilus]MBQ0762901.1 dienelactone hydrolase family protein [Marinobacter psychrophilus]MBQ0846161.1 dienelactone hydrolase family protein [Marinobacter psychrophilus]